MSLKEWRARNRERFNQNQQEWRKNNPKKVLQYQLKKYDITVEEYEELLKRQHGRCAICDSDDPGPKKMFFPVDHDHETGRVRGLLCWTCNVGLGCFKDNPVLLRLAADYIENARKEAESHAA